LITKKVLFISHDDTRTGAPILLINLKNAIIQSNPHFQVDFLIKNCYFIIHDLFSENGNTYVINDSRKKSLFERVKNIFIHDYQLKKSFKKLKKINISSYDVILSNTITNGDILPLVRKLYNGIIVSYIHELSMSSRLYSNNNDILDVIRCTDFFAFPSEAVKQYLIKEYKINSDLLYYLPYYIASPNYLGNRVYKKTNNYFVIGACGSDEWRKGFDVFIQLSLFIYETNSNRKIKFIWKGMSEGTELEKAKYDIEKLGLNDFIELLPSGNDMHEFWNTIDLFLLTSREDPFPLVVLEAAAHKIPTIAFEGSGGAPEFIALDAGMTVPYLSIRNMSNSILQLMDSPDLFKKFKENAFEKFIKTYNNGELISEYFQIILNKQKNV
jgi:glycosyltransferase involved in cell wall biosynthesis